MHKKLIIIALVSLALVSFTIFQIISKGKPDGQAIETVKLGNIVQGVFETGQVRLGEEINLNFKNSEAIEAIYVKIGSQVWAGSPLAKLNTAQLAIKLEEAKAALSLAQAELDKLLAGATVEEIKLAQTAVDNAKTSLANAQQTYNQELQEAKEDALNTLNSSYLKGTGALSTVNYLKKTYFYGTDQDSGLVKEEKGKIESSLVLINAAVEVARASSTQSNIDAALSQSKDSFNSIYDSLAVIKSVIDGVSYRDTVTETDKDSLDTERTNINTALTNVVSVQQAIVTAINTNQAAINTAQGSLQDAEDRLALKIAKPRQSDIDYYTAKVSQQRSQVSLLEYQIADATLRSPVRGQVTAINNEVGETVTALTENVITVLPTSFYEIKVDIYEEDIVKMALGNQVDISFITLPDKIFPGRVISINPGNKVVDGVVYYEVKVGFDETPKEIKQGMSADLFVRTAAKENVLVIPENAVEEKDGKSFVNVYQDKKINAREVVLGLESFDDLVEVVSGLTEGEQIVVD
jgi:HlyD family secretion protein